MASKQVAPPGRRSWRESSIPGAAAPFHGSKTPLRVLMGLVVAGLLAWLGWLLMWPATLEPPTHFVALTTGKSDLLSTPPILFERETLEPIERFHRPERTLNYVGGSAAEGLEDIEAVKNLLAGLRIEDESRLIVYVSAHGVSDDGEAYVLGSGFDVLRPDEGRYSATELIDAVAQQNCDAKLLVFDCSRLAVLPRVGMAVNEFSSIVEKKARAVGDGNLWVMTAASELETSPLGLAIGRSALGGALVDGLIGGADAPANGGDDDRNVTMAELEAFVQLQCSQAPVSTPAPRLIYCGGDTGKPEPNDRVILRIRILEQAETAEEVEEQAAPVKLQTVARLQELAGQPVAAIGEPAESTAEEAVAPPPQADVTATPADAPSAKADETPATAPQSAAATGKSLAPIEPPRPEVKPPAVPVEPAIIRAWRRRDELQKASVANEPNVSPVDYAPHVWNELNATLVALQLKQIGQAKLDAGADSQIGKLQQGLDLLAAGADRAQHGALPTDRLLDSARSYEQSDQKRRLDALPPEYAQAVVDLRRCIFRANQYVEWHASAHCAAGDVGGAVAETAEKIGQLLDELMELDRRLATLENSRLSSWRSAAQVISQVGKVRDKVAELDRSVASEVGSIAGDDDPVMQRRLESLLATGLATAEQRKVMLASIQRAGDDKSRNQSQPRWSAAVDHLRLEIKLVELVDPVLAEDFGAILESSIEDNAEGREQVRLAGRRLGEFYAQLPGRTEKLQEAGARPEELRTVEKMFAVMHPRDAADAAGAPAAAFVTSRLRPPVDVTLTSPARTVLSTDQWSTLSWRLQRRHVEGGGATATVNGFDGQVLDVRWKGAEQTVKPGSSMPVAADRETIELEVKAQRTQEGSIELRTKMIQLSVNVTDSAGNAHEQSGSAQVTIPSEDRIDLIAVSVAPRRGQSELEGLGLRLQPFPNRATTFEFSLANHSDGEKNLQVKLFAAPAANESVRDPAEDGLQPGRVFVRRGQLPPRLAAWASGGVAGAAPIATGEVQLPADGEPRLLVLKAPGGEEEKKPEVPKPGDPAEPAAPAAAPAAKPVVDITHGLLCQIADAAQPDAEPQLRWIEIDPYGPASYVVVEPSYDSNISEVRFEARALELPPGQPISIELTGDGGIPPAGRVVEGKIASADAIVPMIREIDRSVRGIHDFALRIDGFPRAELWRVNFDNGRMERLRDRKFLEIDQVGMLGNETIPARLYRTSSHALTATVDPKEWPTVIDENIEEPVACAFDVSGRARDIVLKLRVDAPLDQLNMVVIGWEDRLGGSAQLADSRQLNGDRSVKSQLAAITEQGGLTIETTVDDFSLSMRAPSVGNKAVLLTARLFVNGNPAVEQQMPVVFDEHPPSFVATLPLRSVPLGTMQLAASIDVVDLSGAALVEAWMTPEPFKAPEELDPKAAVRVTSLDVESFQPDAERVRRVDLRLPISPKFGAGPYFLTLRVTDRSGQSTHNLGSELRFEIKPKPVPVAPRTIGVIQGQVKLGTKLAPAGLRVFVKEQPQLDGETNDDGIFTIDNVDAGDYTLVVEGTVTAVAVVGELPIKKATKDHLGVVITATLRRTPPPKDKPPG